MRSYLPDYDLVVAKDLPTALQLLASGEGWRPMAGGTDLMVLFNAERLPYRRMMSIRNIAELSGIQVTQDSITMGALVTYTQIRQHAALQAEFPLLCKAATWTGGVANQNRGTLGGNIVNASPAADSPPALLVYEASLRIISKGGERWVPYTQFHSGYKQMDLRPDELLAQIRLPRSQNNWQQYSRKVGARKAQAISKVCIAAVARLTNGAMDDVRIALGSVAPIPLRCVQTERLLCGRVLDSSALAAARESILREISPISDIRSTGEYRAAVSANLLSEFLGTLR